MSQDVEAINTIPMGNANKEDQLIWHFTKDGNYTVIASYARLTNNNF